MKRAATDNLQESNKAQKTEEEDSTPHIQPPSKAELAKVGLSEREATAFLSLCNRYLQEHARINKSLSDGFSLSSLQPPSRESFKFLQDFPAAPKEKIPQFLSKVIIIKLNGGLGTTMGLDFPRCALPLGGGKTFLDAIVRQVEYLNKKFGVNVPLVFMNSVHTHEHVQEMLQKFKGKHVDIHSFLQSSFPRMTELTNNLAPKGPPKSESDKINWYPPGSGDVFESFYRSGLLENFLAQGKEWMLLSNVENLGAVFGRNTYRLLSFVFSHDVEYVLEVVERKTTDERGGVLVEDPVTHRLDVIQLSQVPRDKLHMISPKQYKFWSTNNVWVNLKALLNLLKTEKLNLGVAKNIKSGFVQLETYASSAIKCFSKALAVVTPRYRLQQIKTTADLFLLQSNIFVFDEGSYVSLNPKREALGFPDLPNVRFSYEHFGDISQYQSRFRAMPNVTELDYLNVTGDVIFGYNITLKGTVIVVAEAGQKVVIPDGSILENCVVTGSLLILDH